jgi:hypothetical protein
MEDLAKPAIEVVKNGQIKVRPLLNSLLASRTMLTYNRFNRSQQVCKTVQDRAYVSIV